MELPERTDEFTPWKTKPEPTGDIENIFCMKQKLTITEVLVYIQYLSGVLLTRGINQKDGKTD